MPETKTCLWCVNVCDYYYHTIAKKAHDMLGEDASRLRQNTAELCENYATILDLKVSKNDN